METTVSREKRLRTVKKEHTVRYTDSRGRDIMLYGELWAPEGEGPWPAVILSHGFNGHYSDFPLECARFSESGFVCCAFDFCGALTNGKSTGRSAGEYTPYTMVEDLTAVIDDISALPRVNGQVFLFGGSQGGFVTGLTAAERDIKDKIAAIAMYFPAFNIPDDWHGAPPRETPLMGYSIGAGYISSVQDLDPYAAIAGFGGDVCIVYGDRDTLVKRHYIDRAVRAYGEDRVELTVIAGAGHGFTGRDADTGARTVLEFFAAHAAAG